MEVPIQQLLAEWEGLVRVNEHYVFTERGIDESVYYGYWKSITQFIVADRYFSKFISHAAGIPLLLFRLSPVESQVDFYTHELFCTFKNFPND